MFQDEVKTLCEKVAYYRKGHEKFQAAKTFFLQNDENDNAVDPGYLADSTEEIILDAKYPLIKFRKYQLDHLKTKKKYGEAIRFMIDILLEKENYKKKNCGYIIKKFPDVYEIIKTYITKNFNCTLAQINKCITDKCYI